MSEFDVILVTDTATYPSWSRGYGAHRLANHLRSKGYSTLVIDFSSALDFQTWKKICDVAVGTSTKLIGFSCTWWPYRNKNIIKGSIIDYWAEIGEELDLDKDSLTYAAATGQANPWIEFAKEKNKKIKVLLGGPKLDWYLDFPADYFVNGLGENQIIDFLTETRRIWPKVIQHDINSNSKDWGWRNSQTLYNKYDQIGKDEILNLEIARGCKFKCAFCSFPLIGQKDVANYTKSEETIYDELMHNYNNWGVTRYFIADDTYNDSNEKLEMMLRIKNRLPFDLKIKAYIRADLTVVWPQQLKLLKDGGLASCYIGLESFHPNASKFAGKGMKAEKRKQALYDMNAAWGDSVSINVGYIVGLPGEDEAFLREQAEWFARDDCPVNYGVSFIGLMINPVKEGSYMFPSEMDRNPGSFGYSIPNIEKPNHWVKNDGTDITTYSKATELANELNSFVWGSRKTKYDNVDYKDGQVQDPKHYFLKLIEMLKND